MRVRLEGKQYVEQYVHSLTHEMKGPLAAIRSSAELLEAPLPDADRVRFADSIRIQSERLAQMIDKLLALAAVEHRQRIEQPAPVELVALATEVRSEEHTSELQSLMRIPYAVFRLTKKTNT